MHNLPDVDCWVVYHGQVYDLTTYQHPVIGNSVFFCGDDSTSQFAAVHPESYLRKIEDRLVGMLNVQESDQGSQDLSNGGNRNKTDDATRAGPDPTTIGQKQLQAHDSPEDCWTVYHEMVYDMTGFAPNHPIAGPEVIWEFCGADGTEAYSIYHKIGLLSMVQEYYLGDYISSTGPEDSTGTTASDKDKTSAVVLRAISRKEVLRHNQTTDCWTVMYGDVYDLTRYRHPGPPPSYGQRVIYEYSCGEDSTRDYASVHPKDLLKKIRMNHFKIGWVASNVSRVVAVWATWSLTVAGTVLVFLFF